MVLQATRSLKVVVLRAARGRQQERRCGPDSIPGHRFSPSSSRASSSHRGRYVRIDDESVQAPLCRTAQFINPSILLPNRSRSRAPGEEDRAEAAGGARVRRALPSTQRHCRSDGARAPRSGPQAPESAAPLRRSPARGSPGLPGRPPASDASDLVRLTAAFTTTTRVRTQWWVFDGGAMAEQGVSPAASAVACDFWCGARK